MEFGTVIVAGAGISGIGAASVLLPRAEEVVIFDQNEKLDRERVLRSFPEGKKPRIVTGELDEALLKEAMLCILSPGISIHAPFVRKIAEAGIPVWGEVELAYRLAKGRLAAITGTNGKTTTTALVGEIMKNCCSSVFVVGNIGHSYTLESVNTTKDSVTVAEISSFQLESTEMFRPNVSAILNITPDHLDRHGSMECYIETKESIARNQTEDGICVLNYEDPALREFGEKLPIRAWYFSSKGPVSEGAWLEGEDLVLCVDGRKETICNVHEMNLLGVHNYENVLAAVLVSYGLGASLDVIRATVKSFRAVEHRIEFVEKIRGVSYYNDSKGTNPDAAIRAVLAMEGPTVLIGGGYDKHADFTEWIQSFAGRVKHLFLMGQTAEQIARTADLLGFKDYSFVQSMEEAVERSAAIAAEGDSVLLSPACASWGMFTNYEERGRIFKECVRALK